MTYHEKFVAVIKTVDGEIVRENHIGKGESEVKLPFGSEYTIQLKNLNSKRAKVDIYIDGESIFENDSIIVNANSTSSIEGYMIDGVFKNRFKFIKKTKKISDYRGDRIDDGIIRIEYSFERDKNEYITFPLPYVPNPYYPDPWVNPKITWGTKTTTDSSDVGIQSPKISNNCSNSQNAYHMSDNHTSNEDGLTVKGNDIYIETKSVYTRQFEDTSHVIIINLKGYLTSEKKKVNKIITTNEKLKCSTCGSKWKSNIKFCGECGTRLV